MKIYNAQYYCVDYDDPYDQKEFNSAIETHWENTGLNLFDYDKTYYPSYLYRSKSEAFECVPLDGIVGMRICEYDLNEEQCLSIILNRELSVDPKISWYYSWNEKTEKMDFIKSTYG